MQPKNGPLKGAIIRQYVRCGKPNCRCAQGKPHGPYTYRFWRDEEGQAHKQYIRKKDAQKVRHRIAEYKRQHKPFRRVLAEVRTAFKLLEIIERGQAVKRAGTMKRYLALLSR